jgi:tRNA threonylcarbamoyladenosine biosynthesis protein TsaB
MRLLAFDSSGAGCSAAVLIDEAIAAHRFIAMTHGHAAALPPMIEAVLEEAAIAAAALDLIAVTTGPGGFTGLRIGLAAARGLALAVPAPVLGLTSFATVAAGVPAALRANGTLVVALESRRSELFLQAFAEECEPRGPAALVAPAEFAAAVPPPPLLLAGDGAARLAAALPAGGIHLAPGSGIPDAAILARLALRQWRAGGGPDGIALPRPLYLRPPDTSLPRAM